MFKEPAFADPALWAVVFLALVILIYLIFRSRNTTNEVEDAYETKQSDWSKPTSSSAVGNYTPSVPAVDPVITEAEKVDEPAIKKTLAEEPILQTDVGDTIVEQAEQQLAVTETRNVDPAEWEPLVPLTEDKPVAEAPAPVEARVSPNAVEWPGQKVGLTKADLKDIADLVAGHASVNSVAQQYDISRDTVQRAIAWVKANPDEYKKKRSKKVVTA